MARILMIAYTTYIHDARVKRHAQALAARGDQVDLLCLRNPQQGVSGSLNVIGLDIARYRGASRSGYVRSYLAFFALASHQALRLSRRHRYDIAMVCTMPDLAILCALPARLFGSRLVLDVHDTMPELYRDKFGGRHGALGAALLRWEERASAWFADRVLAVHEPHRQRLAASGIDPAKIAVVLNVPNPELFKPRTTAGPDARGERFTLVCHGTMAPRLGVEVAIDAVERLRARLPQIRLLLIGGGEYLNGLRRQVVARNLEQWIEFHEPVPLEELPALLCQADAGLVPNRKSSATDLMLPVKLMEFAALELPIVAARLRAIEYYFDDRAVRYFTPGDADALAAAVMDVYLHPEHRAGLVARARAILRTLNWRVQRQCYYHAIDSLLSSDRNPPASATEVGWDAEQDQEQGRLCIDERQNLGDRSG